MQQKGKYLLYAKNIFPTFDFVLPVCSFLLLNFKLSQEKVSNLTVQLSIHILLSKNFILYYIILYYIIYIYIYENNIYIYIYMFILIIN